MTWKSPSTPGKRMRIEFIRSCRVCAVHRPQRHRALVIDRCCIISSVSARMLDMHTSRWFRNSRTASNFRLFVDEFAIGANIYVLRTRVRVVVSQFLDNWSVCKLCIGAQSSRKHSPTNTQRHNQGSNTHNTQQPSTKSRRIQSATIIRKQNHYRPSR